MTLVISRPPHEKWDNSNGSADYLHLVGKGGTVIGGIDSFGSFSLLSGSFSALAVGPSAVIGNTSAGTQLTALDVEATLNDSNSTRLVNFNLNFKPLANGGSGSSVVYAIAVDPTTPGPNTNTDVYCAQYSLINGSGLRFHDIYGQLISVIDGGGCTELSGVDIQLTPFGPTTQSQVLFLELPNNVGAVQTDFAALRIGDVIVDAVNLPNGNFAIKTGIGIISLGDKITKYNAIATVDNGMPSIYGHADPVAQNAAIAATPLYTPTLTGMYRISAYLKVTTAAGTSSTLGPLTITYTDGTDSVAQSNVMQMADRTGAAAISSTGNTTTTVLTGSMVIYAKTGVPIQYAVAYASNAANAMQYEVHLKAEAL